MKENKILKELVNRGVLEKIAENLGLQCVPYISDTPASEGTIFEAVGTMYLKGSIFSKTITDCSTSGEIRVNLENLEATQKRYSLMCLNKQVAVDVTVNLLRHECFHLYQYESGYWIGKQHDTISFSLKAHGEVEQEMQANQYMIDCTKKKELAEFMEIEQRMPMFVTNEYRAEVREAGMKLFKRYNKIVYLLTRLSEYK